MIEKEIEKAKELCNDNFPDVDFEALIRNAAFEYINSDKVRGENMQMAFGDFIAGAKWYRDHISKD